MQSGRERSARGGRLHEYSRPHLRRLAAYARRLHREPKTESSFDMQHRLAQPHMFPPDHQAIDALTLGEFTIKWQASELKESAAA